MFESLLSNLLINNPNTRLSNITDEVTCDIPCSHSEHKLRVTITMESNKEILVLFSKPSYDKEPNIELMAMNVAMEQDEHFSFGNNARFINNSKLTTKTPEHTAQHIEDLALLLDAKDHCYQFIRWMHKPINKTMLAQEIYHRNEKHFAITELNGHPTAEQTEELIQRHGEQLTYSMATKLINYFKAEAKVHECAVSADYIPFKGNRLAEQHTLMISYGKKRVPSVKINGHSKTLKQAIDHLAGGWFTSDLRQSRSNAAT